MYLFHVLLIYSRLAHPTGGPKNQELIALKEFQCVGKFICVNIKAIVTTLIFNAVLLSIITNCNDSLLFCMKK